MSSDTKPASLTQIEPDDPALTAPEKAAAASPPGGLPKLKILERVEAAKRLSEQGLAVFSVYGVRREGRPPFVCLCSKAGICGSPGKHPQTSDGVYAASRNFADLRVAWRDLRANVGIATGPKSDVWVLDVDPRNGGDETLARLEAAHGKLPATWTVRTGGGGLHYYFRQGSVPVQCSTSRVGPGLDVKGDGGYVVAPPSLHRSGKKYEWEAGRSPDDIEVAEAPEWLLELATGDSLSDGAEGPAIDAPEARATSSEVEGPGGEDHDDAIVKGSRNSHVFHFACDLVRGGVSKTELLEEARTLNTTRCKPPLTDAEVEYIMNSAWRYASPETAPNNAGAIASEVSPSDRPYLDACTVGQLWDQKFPTPRWAIKGIVPEGLGILAGPPKTGKSWFGTQAASSVALGRCTFGDFDVERGKALYCGLEDGPRRFQFRTKKQFADGDIPSSTLFLVAQGQLKTLDQGGLDQLRGFLDKHPTCKFVVIDTYGRFRGGRRSSNNDRYQEDVGIGDKLQRLSHEYGISLLFVHHTRKMGAEDWVDTISGSTGIAGSADFILVLQRVRGGADATLHVTGRDILEQSFAMNFDPQTCLWKITGNAVEVAMSDQRLELRDYLVRLGTPETPTKIAAALELPITNVKNLLWKMREDGQVKSTGRGKYFVEPRPENDLEISDEDLAASEKDAGESDMDLRVLEVDVKAAEEDREAYLKDLGIEN